MQNLIKDNLHPRNLHKTGYDFETLISTSPELSQYLDFNQFGGNSVNFHDPAAVKALNRALLKTYYKIELWDIPDGFLCPPIPGRADHIHYLADLLADDTGHIPRGKSVKILDIGTGANCIYPLLGHQIYGWKFTGSEIDPIALRSAQNIVNANSLSGSIDIRRQRSAGHIFRDIIRKGEMYNASVCNPPFHSSYKEALAGSERKHRNLNPTGTGSLNFGGTSSELYCEGGELGFLNKMITESVEYSGQVKWFSSLISSKDTLKPSYELLKNAGACMIQTIETAQGQKKSRILAWTFLPIS